MVARIRSRQWLGSMVLALALLSVGVAHAQTPASAKALESRLWAPCCYGGTLDTHNSPLSTELRTEIETRLKAGESPDAIQTDFVARYGDKVIAARGDRAIGAMSIAGGFAVLLAALGLALVMRRWVKPEKTLVRPVTTDLDDRLDAELAELDR